jgi:hypothetical protein
MRNYSDEYWLWFVFGIMAILIISGWIAGILIR